MSTVSEHFSRSTTFRTRYLDTCGSRARGDRPVVVLLHDGAWGGDSTTSWSRLLAHVPRGTHVIVPDLLGFGGSEKVVYLDRSPYEFRATAVFDLLDELGIIEPVDLVGSSFGGSVALRSLQVEAMVDRVRSVTSISGTGGPWRTPTGLSELGRFDGTAADMKRIVRLLAEPFDGDEDHLHRRLENALLPGHYQSMMAPHARLPNVVRTPRVADPYPRSLSTSTVPLHLIAGDRDVLVEEGWAEALAGQHGGPAQVTHMDALHSPNISHPAETWSRIAAFLDEIV